MTDFLKNILWATDFSDEAQEALLYAGFFAKTFGAQLLALHVVPDFAPALYEASAVIKGELLQRLDSMKKEANSKLEALQKARRISFDKIIIKEGSASKKIIETSKQQKADLVVMGRRGLSAMEKIFIGSVANQVLRSSSVPVLVTKKKKGKPQVKKILVPTDFSKQEEVERDFAWKLAKGFNASLTLLYVLELYGHEFRNVDEMFKAALKKLKRRKKREKEEIEISEDVTRAIYASHGVVDYAETHSFDLIVMSTYVHKLARFFLGSTTEKVISYTSIPVFAIPPARSDD